MGDGVFKENPDLVLCWFLITEKAKGQESFWFPYLNELPTGDGSVLGWSNGGLEELQDLELSGRITNEAAKERMMALWAVRAELKRDGELFTEEAFAWAYHMVNSRAFGRWMPSLSLVPLADALNHGNVPTKYSFDGEEFILFPSAKSGVTLKAGMEALNSYGRRPNCNLLLEYGFTMENNEWDDVGVALHVQDLVPHFVRKRVLCEKCNIPPKVAMRLGFVPNELVMFFRIVACNEHDLDYIEQNALGTKTLVSSPITGIVEFDALDSCAEALRSILIGFPTSYNQDVEILKRLNNAADSASLPLLFACRYRMGRKRILRFLISYLSQMALVSERLIDVAIKMPEFRKLYAVASGSALNTAMKVCDAVDVNDENIGVNDTADEILNALRV